MKLFKNILKGLIPVFASVMIFASLAGRAYAIPYTGATTPPAPSPAFNVYTGVPSEGNEADFLRGKVLGDTSPSTTNVQNSCATGTKFQLRVYVHNGASQDLNGNGTGPSVARDTKVKVDLKNATSKSAFDPQATLSASNATSKSASMSLTCTNGKVVKLSYITGTAKQFTSAGEKALSDSIVTTGAPIGTVNPDGNVWGCWDQRVYVTLQVEVTEVPVVVTGDGECRVTDVTVLDQTARKTRATINAATTGQGASIIGYEINWGDNTAVSNKQTDEHTYAADGTYTITARVNVKMPDGSTKWVTSTTCTRTVTFKNGTTPVVPPSGKLPDTGAGNILAIFAATAAIAAIAHRFVMRRKSI